MNQKLKNNKFIYILFLFIITIALRFPYHFWDTISIDENVFLILGDLITKGENPHQNFWDIKPALIWYIYSIPIFLSKNIFIIRFCGSIIIFISSYLIFKIALKFNKKNYFIAFGSGFLFIILSSFVGTELPNHQIGLAFHLITEHITNFLFLIFFLCLTNFSKKNKYVYLSFFFFSLCILARYNYVICSVVFLFYLKKSKNFIQNIILGLIIFCIVYILVHFSFLTKDRISDLIDYYKYLSIYGSGDFNKYLNNFLGIYQFIYDPLKFPSLNNTRFLISIFVWSPFFFYFLFFTLKKKKNLKIEKYFFYFGLVIFFSTLFGEKAEHYLIQVAPFASYFALKLINNYVNKKIILSVFLIFIYSSFNSIRTEYQWLFSRLIHKQDLFIGPSFVVNNFLKKNEYNNERVFYICYPLGYFFNNQKPIHKLIHPTQFNKWFLLISKKSYRSELYQDIFNLNPKIVVLDLNQWNVINNPDVMETINTNLKKNYINIFNYKTIKIFKKII
jgi:hypothetical protein